MSYLRRRSFLTGRGIGLAVQVVDGDSPQTDITVAGMKHSDDLVSVLLFDTGVPTDVTSEASIQANGKLQLSTTDSTSKKLLVIYWSI